MLKHFIKPAILSIAWAGPTFALDLPQREGPLPETTSGVPHVQTDLVGDPNLSDELLRRVAEFPGVTLGPTRVSLPGAIGFQLQRDQEIANPRSIVGGMEFAHLHPDGSLHASLHPDLAKDAIAAGWAVAHPWADQRPGWGGFVMIYSPLDQDQLDVVTLLVEQSYEFITGRPARG